MRDPTNRTLNIHAQCPVVKQRFVHSFYANGLPTPGQPRRTCRSTELRGATTNECSGRSSDTQAASARSQVRNGPRISDIRTDLPGSHWIFRNAGCYLYEHILELTTGKAGNVRCSQRRVSPSRSVNFRQLGSGLFRDIRLLTHKARGSTGKLRENHWKELRPCLFSRESRVSGS